MIHMDKKSVEVGSGGKVPPAANTSCVVSNYNNGDSKARKGFARHGHANKAGGSDGWDVAIRRPGVGARISIINPKHSGRGQATAVKREMELVMEPNGANVDDLFVTECIQHLPKMVALAESGVHGLKGKSVPDSSASQERLDVSVSDEKMKGLGSVGGHFSVKISVGVVAQ